MATILLLPDSLPNPPKPICHGSGDTSKIHPRLESTDGEVAAVLDGLVAAYGRHILRHGGGCERCEARS